ncbi:MAG: hypothetical protein ABEJ43_11595 [Haloferacaceae archaeon]
MSARSDEDGDRDETEGATGAPAGVVVEDEEEIPSYDDAYLDAVRDRVMFSYDLERDHRAGGERFEMYGHLHMDRHKQFFHPALRFGHHYSEEHLFVRRAASVDEATLDGLVELGHDLASEWVEADEEHYITEFTFVVVVPEYDAAVESYVSGFRDRTLLKGGYYGHYEVNLVVVAPDRETAVASDQADVAQAFQTWEEIEGDSMGVVERLVRWIWR